MAVAWFKRQISNETFARVSVRYEEIGVGELLELLVAC